MRGVSAGVGGAVLALLVASSYLTAWPDLQSQPTTSDLNWLGGQTRPNLVVVKLGADGKADFYNAAGATDLVIDVVGWYR